MTTRKYRFSLIALMLIATTLLSSCVIDITTRDEDNEKIAGKWTTNIVYTESDNRYDYGSKETLVLTAEGNMTVMTSHYLKPRHSEQWTENLSKPMETSLYRYRSYVTSYNEHGVSGWMSITNPDTYETVGTPDYTVSETSLLIMNEKGKVRYRRELLDPEF